ALPRHSLLGVDLTRSLLFRGDFVNVCVVDARWCWWDGCDSPTVWEMRITSGDEASREDTMASDGAAESKHAKDGFSSRKVFIFAAIGSAVGLGNIWRFPYVAYEGGAGAFLIPYLVALLFAGIPLLYFLYSIGHRNRGS